MTEIERLRRIEDAATAYLVAIDAFFAAGRAGKNTGIYLNIVIMKRDELRAAVKEKRDD